MHKEPIKEQLQQATGLGALLKEHAEEIATAWANKILSINDPRFSHLRPENLYDPLSRTVNTVAEALCTGAQEQLEAHLSCMCIAHMRMGFETADLCRALLLTLDSALPFIRAAYPPESSPGACDAISALSACVRYMVSHVTRTFDAKAARQLRGQQVRMAMILDVVQTAGTTPDPHQVLCDMVDKISKATGAQHCGFYLVEQTNCPVFPTHEASAGTVSTASRLDDIKPRPDETHSALGLLFRQVIAGKQSLFIHDLRTDDRFAPAADAPLSRFRSLLAAPLLVQDRVVALAYVLTTDECRTFSEEEIQTVGDLADSAALAIQNVRRYQEARQQAVLEERDRLSREMHDNLSQALGILKLKSSESSELLSQNRLDRVQANLVEMKTIAGEAYTDAREAIFGLRTSARGGTDLLPVLRKYLTTYRASYGIRTELITKQAPLPPLAPRVTIQALRIIQEALANVRKHAATNQASVCIQPHENGIRITIEDGGRGFNPARAMPRNNTGFGLQVMRERAESVGGCLKIDAKPGSGTRLTAWVPSHTEE